MRCGIFAPLALRRELIATNKRGIIVHSSVFSVKYLPAAENRMAFVVRKKLGKSHERNLVKRRLRESLKTLNKPDIESVAPANTAIHCVIIAKQEAFGYPFNKLDHETKRVFEKIFNQLVS